MNLAEIINEFVQDDSVTQKEMLDKMVVALEETKASAETIKTFQLRSKLTCNIKSWIHDVNAMRTT